jgi:hypothetical protein
VTLSRNDKAEIKSIVRQVIKTAEMDALAERAAAVREPAPSPQSQRADALAEGIEHGRRATRAPKAGDVLFGSVTFEPEKSAEDVAHDRIRRAAAAEASAEDAMLVALTQCTTEPRDDPGEVDGARTWRQALAHKFGT